MAVGVRDGELWVDGERLELEHRVDTADRLAGGHIVVLYEADEASVPSWKAFKNLVAVDDVGNQHWTARTPNAHGDAYVSLVSSEPLIAQSFSATIPTDIFARQME